MPIPGAPILTTEHLPRAMPSPPLPPRSDMMEREGVVVRGDSGERKAGENSNQNQFQGSTGAAPGGAHASLESGGSPPVGWSDDEEGSSPMCRICLECERKDDLIAPCRCRGTSRWVHRSCLDAWRATNEDLAFSRCMECRFEYRLECDPNADRRTKRKYRLYVARDLVASLLLLLAVVALLSSLVWAFGFRGPTAYSAATGCSAACQVGYSVGGGVCVLLSFLGVYGMCVLCVNDCRLDGRAGVAPRQTADRAAGADRAGIVGADRAGIAGAHLHQRNEYCCRDCCVSWWACPGPSDGCCPSDGSCGGDDGGCCAVFLLAFCAFLVLAGFFVGMALAAIKIERTLEEHSWMLQKKRLARDYRVVDLSKAGVEEADLEIGCLDPEAGGNADAPPESSSPIYESKSQHNCLKDLGLAE